MKMGNVRRLMLALHVYLELYVDIPIPYKLSTLVIIVLTCSVAVLSVTGIITFLVLRRKRGQQDQSLHVKTNSFELPGRVTAHEKRNGTDGATPNEVISEDCHGYMKMERDGEQGEHAYATVGDLLQDSPTNHEIQAEKGATSNGVHVISKDDHSYMKMERDRANVIEPEALHTDDKDEYIKGAPVRGQDYVNTTNVDHQICGTISGHQGSVNRDRKLRHIINNFVEEEILPDGEESVTFRTNDGIKFVYVNIS